MTHDVYGEMGGLKGAIGKRADDVLKGLGPDQREIARRVFVQLVHPGKDTETRDGGRGSENLAKRLCQSSGSWPTRVWS